MKIIVPVDILGSSGRSSACPPGKTPGKFRAVNSRPRRWYDEREAARRSADPGVFSLSAGQNTGKIPCGEQPVTSLVWWKGSHRESGSGRRTWDSPLLHLLQGNIGVSFGTDREKNRRLFFPGGPARSRGQVLEKCQVFMQEPSEYGSGPWGAPEPRSESLSSFSAVTCCSPLGKS